MVIEIQRQGEQEGGLTHGKMYAASKQERGKREGRRGGEERRGRRRGEREKRGHCRHADTLRTAPAALHERSRRSAHAAPHAREREEGKIRLPRPAPARGPWLSYMRKPMRPNLRPDLGRVETRSRS